VAFIDTISEGKLLAKMKKDGLLGINGFMKTYRIEFSISGDLNGDSWNFLSMIVSQTIPSTITSFEDQVIL